MNLEKLKRKRFLENGELSWKSFCFTNSKSVCASEQRLKIKLSCLQPKKVTDAMDAFDHFKQKAFSSP